MPSQKYRDLLPVVIERRDIIGELLVLAPVAVIFQAVLEQVAVKLLDVVFGKRYILPRMEDCFHDGGVAGDLLLVAAGKGLDLQIGKKALNFAVGKLTTLDACRRADALDCRNAAQGAEPFRGKRSERPPCSLKLVDLSDQGEDLGRNLDFG